MWGLMRKVTVGQLGVFILGLSICFGTEAQENPQQLQSLKALHKQRIEELGLCERTSATNFPEIVAESRCMEFEVLENPEDPAGRKISLKIMVIPALTPDPALDPVVILAGGPGQAATDMVMLARVFNRARQQREILLVDQRGTGTLSPLQCDIEEDDSVIYSVEGLLAYQEENLPKCLAQMDAAPQYYTTDIAMQDLESIRQYLGYSQFNLWGGSYGTRAALAFLQAYPDSTRSVILDGVAPPTIALPNFVERDASAALEKVFTDCEAQESCAAAYPDLKQHYDALLDSLSEPKDITVFDGLDNSSQEMSINKDMVMALLRFTLYSREAQRLTPYLIEQAYSGNFQPLVGIASPGDGINQFMMMSVLCSEDYSLIQSGQFDQQNKQNYRIHSDLFTDTMLAACEMWPKRQVAQEYFEPVVSDKPVLVFSGAFDPVTPQSWGDLVAKTLSSSRHFVVDGFAHNTMNSPCAIDILNDFVESATVDSIESECLKSLKRRPFFVNAGGAARGLAND